MPWNLMDADHRAFARNYLESEHATRLLVRLRERLALSLRLAGMSLSCFASRQTSA